MMKVPTREVAIPEEGGRKAEVSNNDDDGHPLPLDQPKYKQRSVQKVRA